MTLTNPNEPATKRQLWALFLATKKDHRKLGLTKQEAFDLLQEVNKDKPQKIESKDELFEYMKENSYKINESFRKELQLESKVSDDIVPTRKSYIFFGSGMGFSHIKYDKRSKKAERIISEYNSIRGKFDNWFINEYFSPKEILHFKDIGFPLQAMMFQDLKINISINLLVIGFMKKQGIDNVSLINRYD